MSKKQSSTPQQRGAALENRVAQLLMKSGESNVKTNVMLRDANNNISEIDVVYGRWPFKKYVECKSYLKKSVPLEDVAKFKEVLRLQNINISRGMLVTNSKFTPRCASTGIRLINGTQLKQWEARVQRNFWMKRSILTVTCTGLLAATYIYPKETKEIGLKVMKECQQQCNQMYKWCIQQMER